MMLFFFPNSAFRNDYNRSHVQVVEDGNDEVIREDDVFQIDELVNPYLVALFTELENPNFYAIENTYIEVDVDELSVILNNSAHRKVDEDDEINHENNREDNIGHANDENAEEDFD
jgi:hypothetical protein